MAHAPSLPQAGPPGPDPPVTRVKRFTIARIVLRTSRARAPRGVPCSPRRASRLEPPHMRLIRLLLILALAMPGLAAAQSFDLPGLGRDAAAYQQEMHAPLPRRRHRRSSAPRPNSAPRQAEGRRDYAAAAAAWEERIGMGQPNADALAGAGAGAARRNPPDNQRALQAGWRAFQLAAYGEPEVAPLMVIAEALRRLDRPVQQIEALEAILERADSPEHRQRLEAARRAAGMLVRRVTPEADAEPARACLAFTNPPARRTDWQPQDWVRADPPIPSPGGGTRGRPALRRRPALGAPPRASSCAPACPARTGQNLRQRHRRRRRHAEPRPAHRLRHPRLHPAARAGTARRRRHRQRHRHDHAHRARGRAQPGAAAPRLDAGRGAGILDRREHQRGDGPRRSGKAAPNCQRVEPNRTQRSILPLPDVLRSAGPGVYLLVLRQAESRRGGGETAALPFFVTDIGLTAWRGADGLAVQARSLQAGHHHRRPARHADGAQQRDPGRGPHRRRRPGPLPRRADARHRADGARRGACRDRPTTSPRSSSKPRPSTCRTAAPPAAPHPGPVDAFLWLDRGIYRPGETVNAARADARPRRASRSTCRSACACAARTGRSPPRSCRRARMAAPSTGRCACPPARPSAHGRSRC